MTDHQPLIIHSGEKPPAIGDRVLCEQGHLFGTVLSHDEMGWPAFALAEGQADPTHTPFPLRCKCGARAMLESPAQFLDRLSMAIIAPTTSPDRPGGLAEVLARHRGA